MADNLNGPILYWDRNPDDPGADDLFGTAYIVLVDTDAELARCVDDKKMIAYPPVPVAVLIRDGYWTAYDGPADAVTKLLPDLTIVGAEG